MFGYRLVLNGQPVKTIETVFSFRESLHATLFFSRGGDLWPRWNKVNLEVQCHARLTIPRGKVKKNERPPVCWN